MTIEKIKSLLQARYNLIYVNTFEESRFIDEISKLAQDLSFDVVVWSYYSGLTELFNLDGKTIYDTIYDRKVSNTAGNPLAVFEYLEKTEDDTLVILKDYHVFLKDAEVVRALKDSVQLISVNYTPIVIVSPVTRIPIELEKEITLVDYSLPDKTKINEILDIVLNSINIPIEVSKEEKEKIVRACSGLTAIEIENALSRSLIETGSLDPNILLEEKKQIIRKSNILEYIEPEELKNVGGMQNLKKWLAQRKLAFTEEAKKFGLQEPKGILLLGVPGCGKSLFCKAVASDWNMPLLKLDIGSVMQSLVGSSEENMRKAIKVAESISPCILWLDEIEKGLSGTASSNFSDSGTTSRVFSIFLNWLQEKKKPVFVIATANDLSQLPNELLRKGRFDDIFFIDLPNHKEREEIFKIHLRKRNRDPNNFDTLSLALETKGFSGAEIEQIIIDALFDAYYNDRTDIRDNHIMNAIRKAIPLSKTRAKEIKMLREKARKIAKLASQEGEI